VGGPPADDDDVNLSQQPRMTINHSDEIMKVQSKQRAEWLPGMQDPDVVQERTKVRDMVRDGNLNPKSSAIFIYNLRKIYYARGSVPSKVAVKDVSVSIGQGEVFGLLGANGKYKSCSSSWKE
jgi:ABC-type glutathione transport system ATPase component